MSPVRDISGQKFGRLLAIKSVGRRPMGNTGQKQTMWECVCDCGTVATAPLNAIVSGRTKSCGCLLREKDPDAWIRKPEFAIYRGMLARCRNPNVKHYANYGGRGISVSPEWEESFANFFTDMGPRPSPKHSVERRDADGNYCKENCYWATTKQQARNKRNTRWVIYKGERMPLTAAVEKAGNIIHYEAAWVRIRDCRWPVERAVETPSAKAS